MPHRPAADSPRAHWLLLTTLLLAICGLLLVHALAAGAIGAYGDPPAGGANHVPETARSGGSLIDPRHPTAIRPADRRLALVFADGPDPTWTPAVLATLARHRVRASFFVTGAHAAQHPGLVQQIVAAGHEVGSRTTTGVDLRRASARRVQLELQATELALAGTAGVTTNLVQPPAMGDPSALDDAAWDAVLRIGNAGWQVVVPDLDSQDLRHPGAEAIVANATPRDGRGVILLMHDAGGAQTIAALDRLVPLLRGNGWQIDTVSGALAVSGATGDPGPLGRVAGLVLVGTVQVSTWFAAALRGLLVAATVLAGLRAAMVLLSTALHVRRTRGWRLAPQVREPASVIVPAYDEEAGIATTVRSVAASYHPAEVVVVDDGSTDQTAAIVRALQRRLPDVRLIRQHNAGKAAALNTGLAAARSDLVVMVDGDTVLEPTAVGRLVQHFADPWVGAVSGNAKVSNRERLLGRWQHIEYVIGFNLDRRMYDVLRCMPTVPGAIGAFRRSAVQEVGGVPGETLAEDTDLTMAMQREGWRVTYEENARAWTEAPATVGQLWKQRYRWCYGTLQAVWKHRRAVLERGQAGRLGRVGLPYLVLFQVLLQLLAPVVDVTGLFGMLTDDAGVVATAWAGFVVLQAVPGLIAFRLDRERLRPLLSLPLQQVVYRQLMYLVVVQSVVTALAGARLPWQKLERHGGARPVGRGGTGRMVR